MRVQLRRRVKVHKTTKRAATHRCAMEMAEMMSGLTLNQMRSVIRYTKLLQSSNTTGQVH